MNSQWPIIAQQQECRLYRLYIKFWIFNLSTVFLVSSKTWTKEIFWITEMQILLLPILAFIASIPGSSSLACRTCNPQTCRNPSCCDSGRLIKDACGCCGFCAKRLHTACGGPWNQYGTCQQGTRCLTICPKESFTGSCLTSVTGKKCIFPFSYKGKNYGACTSDISDKETAPRCATKVGATGEAKEWDTCKPNCTLDKSCGGDLSLYEGTCTTTGYEALEYYKSVNISAEVGYVYEKAKHQKPIAVCLEYLKTLKNFNFKKYEYMLRQRRKNWFKNCVISKYNDNFMIKFLIPWIFK